MALDTTMYAVDVPAGTYSAGDVLPLVCTDGPANVRSGRGTAVLKSILIGQATANAPFWKIHVKNSDWIDEVSSFTAGSAGTLTAFDDESGAIQSGHDCNLTQNSGWQVFAECVYGGTSTAADSLYALIDVDYPQVSAITSPKSITGIPTSIDFRLSTTSDAFGSMTSASWKTVSTDYLKAGFKYVLDAVEYFGVVNTLGFVKFSNASGMGGLSRIIPVSNNTAGIRYSIRYASILQKGPMEIGVKLFTPSAGPIDAIMVHDYVKKVA